ncbi:MAG TPA: VCBS repeat-containing protein [Polyangia bacterium]|nr:VCBS repeat-containing protein [Polyangia bacterium]
MAGMGGQAGNLAQGGFSGAGGGGVVCAIKGDFDGDGTPDCATVSSAKQLSFYKGVGAGGYQATAIVSSLPCWGSLTLPAVADVDGDGRDDIVQTTNQSGLGYDAVLFLGQSNGTFQCPTSESSASFPRGFQPTYLSVTGDFTKDGRKDVFFVAVSGTMGSNQVQWIVFSGMTVGSNQLRMTATSVAFILGTCGAANPTSAQDLDADTNLDVVVSAQICGMGDAINTPQTINVYGNGDGTFHCGGGQTVSRPNPTQQTGMWVCQSDGTYAASN